MVLTPDSLSVVFFSIKSTNPESLKILSSVDVSKVAIMEHPAEPTAPTDPIFSQSPKFVRYRFASSSAKTDGMMLAKDLLAVFTKDDILERLELPRIFIARL